MAGATCACADVIFLDECLDDQLMRCLRCVQPRFPAS